MKPICVIAPYNDIAIKTQEVVAELMLPAEIYTGMMEHGVKMANQAISQGAEVIVSRGGTATLLKKTVKVPVVEIQVSTLDVLNILDRLMKTDKKYFKSLKIGLIGYQNVILGAETISSILDIKLYKIILDSAQEETRQEIKSLGINFVLGDASGLQLGQDCGIEGLLIDSSREAIASALFEAERVMQVKRIEQEKAQLFKSILDVSRGGIVAVDNNNEITVINPAAEAILGIEAKSSIGVSSQLIIPELNLKEVIEAKDQVSDLLVKINDRELIINKAPIKIKGKILGVAAALEDVTKIQQLEQGIRKNLYSKGLTAQFNLTQVAAKSKIMMETINKAYQFAGTESTILITGESGTGKELFAQGIHNASTRKEGPFVGVNCAALSESLLESELFGYVDGAFTGARKGGKLGLFEMAHGGTLFLDEIGEMPLLLQTRLLRVLQLKEVMRIGGDRVIPINVRIISSTNRDLLKEVQTRRFREDLYYRVNVLSINVPPLRERPEDITYLIATIMDKLISRVGKVVELSAEVKRLLTIYNWPGNVRQLENVLERIIILSKGQVVEEFDFENAVPELRLDLYSRESNYGTSRNSMEITGTLFQMERAIIKRVLEEENGNQTRVAKRLDVDRSTLWRKLKKK